MAGSHQGALQLHGPTVEPESEPGGERAVRVCDKEGKSGSDKDWSKVVGGERNVGNGMWIEMCDRLSKINSGRQMMLRHKWKSVYECWANQKGGKQCFLHHFIAETLFYRCQSKEKLFDHRLKNHHHSHVMWCFLLSNRGKSTKRYTVQNEEFLLISPTMTKQK